MDALSGLGRVLILVGVVFVLVGLLLSFLGRVPYIGRLPGDILIRRGNFTFYFPLATSLLLSFLLTLLLWLLRR